MRRLRIYAVCTTAALASAVAVTWIATRIEMRNAHQAFERMQANMGRLRDSQGAGGGMVGGVEYGPGLFTLFLTILVFATVFYCLYRWQGGSAGE